MSNFYEYLPESQPYDPMTIEGKGILDDVCQTLGRNESLYFPQDMARTVKLACAYVAIAGTVGGVLGVSLAKIPGINPGLSNTIASLEDEECLKTTEISKQAALIAIRGEDNYDFYNAARESIPNENLWATTYEETRDNNNEFYINRVLVEAKKYGFEIEDPTTSLEAIKTAQSLSEILENANLFAKNYGIEISTHDNGYGDILKEASLEEFRRHITKLTVSIFLMPKELIEYSGLKNIVLIYDFNESHDGGETIGKTTLGGDTMAISLNGLKESDDDKPNQGQVFAHELGHLIDGRMCEELGGAESDEEYNELNGQRNVYGNEEVGHDNRTFAYSYGAAGIREDKATVLESLLSIDQGGTLNSLVRYGEDTPIYNKLWVLMARLEEVTPGISQYLLTVGALSKFLRYD